MKMLVMILAVPLAVFAQAPGGLSPETARATIENSFQHSLVGMDLPLGRVGTHCADKGAGVYNYDPTSDIWSIAVQKAGFVTVKPDGLNYWKVAFADIKPGIAETLKKIPHKVANGCDYQDFGLFVAKKSVVDVIRINRLTDSKAEVEFTWKWVTSQSYSKLPEVLSADEQKAFEAYLSRRRPPEAGPQFRVADINEKPDPHPGKRTLKRAVDGWHIGLDGETAAQVIKKAFDLQSKGIEVPIGRVGANCAFFDNTKIPRNLTPDEIDTVVAAKAGFVTVREDGPGYWKIDLTKRGLSLREYPYAEKPQNGCDFQSVFFAVARRSVVRITNITEGEDTAEVDYLWRWDPTELGVALRETGEIYTKLTAAQRSAAKMLLGAGDISPALPLPVPAQSPARAAKMTLHKSGNGWVWLP